MKTSAASYNIKTILQNMKWGAIYRSE
jgi:hypothetical protein